jgi:hypothetical protein
MTNNKILTRQEVLDQIGTGGTEPEPNKLSTIEYAEGKGATGYSPVDTNKNRLIWGVESSEKWQFILGAKNIKQHAFTVELYGDESRTELISSIVLDTSNSGKNKIDIPSDIETIYIMVPNFLAASDTPPFTSDASIVFGFRNGEDDTTGKQVETTGRWTSRGSSVPVFTRTAGMTIDGKTLVYHSYFPASSDKGTPNWPATPTSSSNWGNKVFSAWNSINIYGRSIPICFYWAANGSGAVYIPYTTRGSVNISAQDDGAQKSTSCTVSLVGDREYPLVSCSGTFTLNDIQWRTGIISSDDTITKIRFNFTNATYCNTVDVEMLFNGTTHEITDTSPVGDLKATWEWELDTPIEVSPSSGSVRISFNSLLFMA